MRSTITILCKFFLAIIFMLSGDQNYLYARTTLTQLLESTYACHQTKAEAPKIDKITLPLENGVAILKTDKIICGKKLGKDIILYCQHEEHALCIKHISLLELTSLLKGSPHFFRLNSHLVNLSYVEKILHKNICKEQGSKYYQYTIILAQGIEVPLPKAKRKACLEQLNALLKYS